MVAKGASAVQLTGLARRLVSEGLAAEEEVRQAHEEAQKQKIPFISYLVQNRLADSAQVAELAAHEFGMPLLDISAIDLDQAPVKLVEEKLIRRHHALPLYKRGNRLYVAIANPTNLRGLDEIKFHTNLSIEPVLAREEHLDAAIDTALTAADAVMEDLAGDDELEDIEFGEDQDLTEEESGGLDTAVDDTPVVRFVNKVLLDAIKRGASDIHFEPYESDYRVRFRMDGMLRKIASPPQKLAPRLGARLKVMAGLDIAERRVPQDGRIKLNVSKKRAIDFRVSSCPTIFGEKIVLRILDPAAARLGIDKLGYDEVQKEQFMESIHKPYGMVIVTGPTGSGKTVSLYTALNILNTEGRNISTVEDPVEIRVPGINQVAQNVKSGMTFAKALRAFLRQDPDVIMVGEIRDLETAEIAIKAAQTGHMVLSTLHTNDAPQSITRLMNMGVAPYNITSAVSLVIAQRLARQLCDNCKRPMEQLPKEALLREGFKEDELDELKLFEAVGCSQCNEGYKGRTGIFQVMPITDRVSRIILEAGNAVEITEQAKKDGIKDLRESGLDKARQGITSLEEVNRVTKD